MLFSISFVCVRFAFLVLLFMTTRCDMHTVTTVIEWVNEWMKGNRPNVSIGGGFFSLHVYMCFFHLLLLWQSFNHHSHFLLVVFKSCASISDYWFAFSSRILTGNRFRSHKGFDSISMCVYVEIIHIPRRRCQNLHVKHTLYI